MVVRQRIDRWLWHARLVRTRGAGAALAGGGFVRVNGARIDAPGRMVRAGDVVTVALDRGVRVVKVMGFVERRGPASTAVGLFQDLQWGTEGIWALTRGEQTPPFCPLCHAVG